MSKRFRWLLTGACALLAVLCAVAYGEEVRAQVEASRSEALERYGGEVAHVVVATQPVAEGEALDASNCALKDWLVDLVPEGALASLDDVTGAVAAGPVAKGSPVCSVNLQSDAAVPVKVPPGCVALSVPVNDKTGVTAQVAPGTSLAAFKVSDGETRLISEVVEVLAADGRSSGQAGQITLSVKAEDVSPLMAAGSDGSLRLVMVSDEAEGLLGVAAASPAAE